MSDGIGGPRTPLRDLLESAFPFMFLSNGDLIALDISRGEEGEVVNLSHERDEPMRLAATFEDFLAAWERLCYVGPECWELEPFVDPMTGYLDPSLPPAEALRRTFRDAMPDLTV